MTGPQKNVFVLVWTLGLCVEVVFVSILPQARLFVIRSRAAFSAALNSPCGLPGLLLTWSSYLVDGIALQTKLVELGDAWLWEEGTYQRDTDSES